MLFWFTWEKCFTASFRGKPRSSVISCFSFCHCSTALIRLLTWKINYSYTALSARVQATPFRQPQSGIASSVMLPPQIHSPAVHINVCACCLHSRSASEGQVLDIKILAKCSTSFINASACSNGTAHTDTERLSSRGLCSLAPFHCMEVDWRSENTWNIFILVWMKPWKAQNTVSQGMFFPKYPYSGTPSETNKEVMKSVIGTLKSDWNNNF